MWECSILDSTDVDVEEEYGQCDGDNHRVERLGVWEHSRVSFNLTFILKYSNIECIKRIFKLLVVGEGELMKYKFQYDL